MILDPTYDGRNLKVSVTVGMLLDYCAPINPL